MFAALLFVQIHPKELTLFRKESIKINIPVLLTCGHLLILYEMPVVGV